jgi:hypothetical protein
MVLSDRIAVLDRGNLEAVLDGRTANREEVGLLRATGGTSGEVPKQAEVVA